MEHLMTLLFALGIFYFGVLYFGIHNISNHPLDRTDVSDISFNTVGNPFKNHAAETFAMLHFSATFPTKFFNFAWKFCALSAGILLLMFIVLAFRQIEEYLLYWIMAISVLGGFASGVAIKAVIQARTYYEDYYSRFTAKP